MKAANIFHPFRAPMRGFTLLELMTAVTVMAILLGIGVPAFNQMVRDGQLASESNNLFAAMTLARSEAVKRSVRVSVCASPTVANTPNDCDKNGDWTGGWMIFADDFGDSGTLDPSDVPLQIWPAPAPGTTITTVSKAVTFDRTGRAEFEGTFQVSKAGCTSKQLRQIAIGLSGRVSLTREDCAK
jgi:type IV fimbrial biogenesis protein FimT